MYGDPADIGAGVCLLIIIQLFVAGTPLSVKSVVLYCYLTAQRIGIRPEIALSTCRVDFMLLPIIGFIFLSGAEIMLTKCLAHCKP
jgi:hypothetical protein